MKFVVTGGAGFIGSNIAKLLVKKGHDVIILDNFNTGRKENLESIKDKIDLHNVDIRDKKIINEIINESDGIFHQAALANVYESFSKSKEYFDVNVTGTKNIFEIATENKIKVVFASSSSVYGEVKMMPITENIDRNPIHPYGQTKLECEFLAEKFSKEGLKVIGLRYFNVYGLGQNDAYAGVITKFLNKIKENKSPEIFGDGSQTRDFIFVKDVANANLSAMESEISFEFFNIGSQKSISILELAQIIIKKSGLNLKPEFKEPLQGDAKISLSDITLAIKKLQWNPTYKLDKWFEEEVFNE
jgi:UDP-glucose 4-epimerase